MRDAVIAKTVVIAILGWYVSAAAQEASGPALTAQEVSTYRQIAHHTFDRIVALRGQYPHLRSIETDVRKDEASDKLWIAYHYEHGMSLVPNPHYVAGKKNSRTAKRFSPKDGVELHLYFYEGPWLGQAAVSPLAIGNMHIVTFIEGRETKQLAALRAAIGEIVQDEQAAFQEHRH